MSHVITIVDYGSGNLRSVEKAMLRAINDSGVPADVLVTNDAEKIRRADKIILPGVGAFGDCIQGLAELPGMLDALEERVVKQGTPFLGICVGMQLMARRGLEHGEHAGLNWIGGEILQLCPADKTLKVPHIGWNELELLTAHPVLAHLPQRPRPHAYFVHSYAFRVTEPKHLQAVTDYGGPVAAVVARDNLIGTQFHPEKSQSVGLALLQNFARWSP